MMSDEKLSFKILDENVASEDLFEGKPHERVSKSLYALIKNAEKPVTIGLEGTWGSGKSTVINLLKNKIENDGDQFFIFDAWAHEGDPLRRIFLESLIQKLHGNNQSEIENLQEQLAGRKKTVETTITKGVSKLGRCLSISALLVPVGAALLRHVDFSILFSDQNTQANFYLSIFGALLSFAPVLILIWWFFCGDRYLKKGQGKWDFFSSTSTEEHQQDISEDEERSSIEFAYYFKKIITTALDINHNKKIIIVIDNLDRISPKQAKSIWSTLQTFFQHRSSSHEEEHSSETSNENNEWFNRVWFIVPYDHKGFINIWDQESDIEQTSGVADSFLEKNFQIIAEVPQPVMSGWVDYLRSCIKEALCSWSTDDQTIIANVYIQQMGALESSPTPRSIKKFINQVGYLGSIWEDTFSTKALGYYALLRIQSTANEFRERLLDGSLLADNQKHIFFEIQAELAGLLFGVDQSRGMELLLGPEIHNAFKTSDNTKLKKLEETHQDAFWIAFRSTKEKWFPKDGSPDGYKKNFTKTLFDSLFLTNKIEKPDINSLTNIWLNTFQDLDFENNDHTEAIESLILMNSNQFEIATKIKEHTYSVLNEFIKSLNDKQTKVKFPRYIFNIFDLLPTYGVQFTAKSHSNLNTDNWKTWLDLLEENDIDFNLYYPNDDVIDDITNECNFNQDSLDLPSIKKLFSTYKTAPNSKSWKKTFNGIIAWHGKQSRDSNANDIYLLLIKFITNTGNTNLSKDVVKVVKKEEFWQKAQRSKLKDNPSLPLLAAITLKDEVQNTHELAAEIKEFWKEPVPDMNFLQAVYDELKSNNSLECIWHLARDSDNQKAINIIRKFKEKELYSCEAGAMYIDEFDWLEEDETKEIAELLIKHKSFKKLKPSMLNNPELYANVFSIFYSINDQVTNSFINDEVEKITKEQWLKVFESSNHSVLLELLKANNLNFSNAFEKYLDDVVQGKKELSSLFTEKLPNLLNKVSDIEWVKTKITEAYFNTTAELDLSQKDFEAIKAVISFNNEIIDEKRIQDKLCTWILENHAAKIDWLINARKEPFSSPLTKLKQTIESIQDSEDKSKISLANKVNDHFLSNKK